jgi:hypothetical protein
MVRDGAQVIIKWTVRKKSGSSIKGRSLNVRSKKTQHIHCNGVPHIIKDYIYRGKNIH